MQKLYFIRHGQTQDNVDGRFGRLSTVLTDAGRAQAVAAGLEAKEKGLRFDVLLSSPLPRALETARLFAHEIGYPEERIETDDRLVERKLGSLEGTLYSEFFDGTRIYKDLDGVNGTERIEDLQQRAAAVLNYIQSRPEATFLVVSHGGFGRAFRRAIQNIPFTDEYREDRPHDIIENALIAELI